jgi:IS6 family transposase
MPTSAFKGFRFPPEIIVLAVRWYLRFGLSYRDVEELLTERGIEVDHVTVYRWVQRFTPLLADAARPCRHAVGDRWYVDETYVKVAGRWRYVYRAVDQDGQIIDVYVSARRDTRAARRFFTTALRDHDEPAEVVTDRAWTLLTVVDELMPGAFHNTAQYANNRIEADHGRLKSRLRPMRGLKHDHSARVVMRGHAFMQNIRRGHYELGVDARASARRVRVHRTRPSHLTGDGPQLGLARPGPTQRNRAHATELRGEVFDLVAGGYEVGVVEACTHSSAHPVGKASSSAVVVRGAAGGERDASELVDGGKQVFRRCHSGVVGATKASPGIHNRVGTNRAGTLVHGGNECCYRNVARRHRMRSRSRWRRNLWNGRRGRWRW